MSYLPTLSGRWHIHADQPTASPALRQHSSDFLYNYDAKSQRRRQFPLRPVLNEGGEEGRLGRNAGVEEEAFQVNVPETSFSSSSSLSLRVHTGSPSQKWGNTAGRVLFHSQSELAVILFMHAKLRPVSFTS